MLKAGLLILGLGSMAVTLWACAPQVSRDCPTKRTVFDPATYDVKERELRHSNAPPAKFEGLKQERATACVSAKAYEFANANADARQEAEAVLYACETEITPLLGKAVTSLDEAGAWGRLAIVRIMIARSAACPRQP